MRSLNYAPALWFRVLLQMQEETDEMYRAADASGLPARYVHEMRDKQWDYINRFILPPSLILGLAYTWILGGVAAHGARHHIRLHTASSI